MGKYKYLLIFFQLFQLIDMCYRTISGADGKVQKKPVHDLMENIIDIRLVFSELFFKGSMRSYVK